MKFCSLKFLNENKKLYKNIKKGIAIDIANIFNCIFFKRKKSIIKNMKTNKYKNLMKVQFVLQSADVFPGEQLFLSRNIKALGNWNVSLFLYLL